MYELLGDQQIASHILFRFSKRAKAKYYQISGTGYLVVLEITDMLMISDTTLRFTAAALSAPYLQFYVSVVGTVPPPPYCADLSPLCGSGYAASRHSTN